jgi:hypothetical protein
MSSPSRLHEGEAARVEGDLRTLFHRLNNQLGIILAHAELLERKMDDESLRRRTEQVVASVLDAMKTAREIRRRSEIEA